MRKITMYDAAGNGGGIIVPTLTGGHENTVADTTAILVEEEQKAFVKQSISEYKESDVGSTCSARDYKSCTDLVVNKTETQSQNEEIAKTLHCMHDQQAIVTAVDCRNMTENADVNGTLQAKSNGGYNLNSQNTIRQGYAVRRLTPLECERLQGLPDNWTNIGAWTDKKGKLHKECSDAARYKAIGNGIACPPWRWLLERLSKYCGEDKTMASLFDGIGSFPWIWESINGEGSCRWGSEIEDFPDAISRYHFPDKEGE